MNEKEGYGLKSNFKPLPINKKDELRKKFTIFKYAAAIARRKIGFGFTLGFIFQLMWLAGMILTLLSLCGVFSNEYSLAVFLCFPNFLSYDYLNIAIIEILFYQFETGLFLIYTIIFCISGMFLV